MYVNIPKIRIGVIYDNLVTYYGTHKFVFYTSQFRAFQVMNGSCVFVAQYLLTQFYVTV